MQQQLAKITKAGLSIVDSGILTFNIEVRYESGLSQSIGYICLDTYKAATNDEPRTRVGTAYGCEIIRQLLLTLEVDNLNDAKDKIIWVLGSGTVENFNFAPTGLKTLSVHGTPKIIDFKAIYDEMKIK